MNAEVDLEGCIAVRLLVEQLAPPRIAVGVPGVICIGVSESDGLAPLIAICDEGRDNSGASATNCVDDVLGLLRRQWGGTIDVERCNVVEFDSDAKWDHVHTTWDEHGSPEVNWSPIRWPGTDPRSEEALRGAFGRQADRVLAVLDRVIATGEASFRAN